MSRFENVSFAVSQKTGRAWAKAMIDGEKYVAFDEKTLTTLRGLQSGAAIDVTSRSGTNGDKILTGITVGAGTGASLQTAPVVSVAHAPSVDARQVSILYGYAKDAVLAGAGGDYIKTPAAFADRVGTVAYELYRQYQRALNTVEDATKGSDPTV